jgi:UDPglucose 6-dehydrogenase
MELLPRAPYNSIVDSKVAAMIKYGGNNWFYLKVLFMNTLYDICHSKGIDFNEVVKGMAADPRVGPTHLEAVHQGGRGAGGHCFIKDFAAYKGMAAEAVPPEAYYFLLYSEEFNATLLRETGKDLDILDSVYGERL